VCEGNQRDNDEVDCRACDGKGYFEVGQCPAQLVDEELAACFPIADLFFEGVPPRPVGSLGQTQWFMAFATRVKGEDNRIQAAMNARR
jgi:hypothetical protein